MVRLTADLLMRCASTYVKKQRDESRKHYLHRITHLHLEGRNIDDIGEDLCVCRSLIVLYVYDNALSTVPDLQNNVNLTHLYLQNNNISTLENLTVLSRLTKLYVSGNSIVVVEGLEKLYQLQELHIENQKLPSGEKLLFDPRSIEAVARTLLVLNISGNRVTSLSDLGCLSQLKQLLATDNDLSDLQELSNLLRSWRYLERLDITNNPLCRCDKYRDKLIVVSSSLEILDGSEVTNTARQFLRNWEAKKEAVKHQRENASHMSDGYGRGGSSDAYSTVPASYVMPALNHHGFQKVLSRSKSQQSVRGDTAGRERDSRHLVGPRSSKVLTAAGYTGTGIGTGPVDDGSQSIMRHLSLLNIGAEHLAA